MARSGDAVGGQWGGGAAGAGRRGCGSAIMILGLFYEIVISDIFMI